MVWVPTVRHSLDSGYWIWRMPSSSSSSQLILPWPPPHPLPPWAPTPPLTPLDPHPSPYPLNPHPPLTPLDPHPPSYPLDPHPGTVVEGNALSVLPPVNAALVMVSEQPVMLDRGCDLLVLLPQARDTGSGAGWRGGGAGDGL